MGPPFLLTPEPVAQVRSLEDEFAEMMRNLFEREDRAMRTGVETEITLQGAPERTFVRWNENGLAQFRIESW